MHDAKRARDAIEASETPWMSGKPRAKKEKEKKKIQPGPDVRLRAAPFNLERLNVEPRLSLPRQLQTRWGLCQQVLQVH